MSHWIFGSSWKSSGETVNKARLLFNFYIPQASSQWKQRAERFSLWCEASVLNIKWHAHTSQGDVACGYSTAIELVWADCLAQREQGSHLLPEIQLSLEMKRNIKQKQKNQCIDPWFCCWHNVALFAIFVSWTQTAAKQARLHGSRLAVFTLCEVASGLVFTWPPPPLNTWHQTQTVLPPLASSTLVSLFVTWMGLPRGRSVIGGEQHLSSVGSWLACWKELLCTCVYMFLYIFRNTKAKTKFHSVDGRSVNVLILPGHLEVLKKVQFGQLDFWNFTSQKNWSEETLNERRKGFKITRISCPHSTFATSLLWHEDFIFWLFLWNGVLKKS